VSLLELASRYSRKAPEVQIKNYVIRVKMRNHIYEGNNGWEWWQLCIKNTCRWSDLLKWQHCWGRSFVKITEAPSQKQWCTVLISRCSFRPLDCGDHGFESRWGLACSSVVCCVGRGLCDRLITNPGVSKRVHVYITFRVILLTPWCRVHLEQLTGL